MPRPINQQTLAAISGEHTARAADTLSTAMMDAAKFREVRKQNASMQELRGMQMQQIELGMEKSQYDLAQSKLDDQIEVTNREIQERYRKNYEPIREGATATEYTAKANEAFMNKDDVMAQHYLDMAEEAAKPVTATGLSEMEKLVNAEKRAVAAGDYKSAAVYKDAIQKKNDQEAAVKQLSPKAIDAQVSGLKSEVGDTDAEGFGDAVSNAINVTADAYRKANQGVVLDTNKIATAVIAEANKGDEGSFIDSGTFDDQVDYAKVQAFIEKEIAAQVGAAPTQASPTEAQTLGENEVIRISGGKEAIFDSKTQKFIRWK